jgi:hypothetical protein
VPRTVGLDLRYLAHGRIGVNQGSSAAASGHLAAAAGPWAGARAHWRKEAG